MSFSANSADAGLPRGEQALELDQQAARAEEQRLRHGSPRPAARAWRQSAAAARRTRAARAARRARGRGRRRPARRSAAPGLSRGSCSSSPTVATPMLRKNSTSSRVTSTGSASSASPSPRESQSAARGVGAAASRAGKPSATSPAARRSLQGLEAAVQAQAALHFQQQLLRRLERNLRRELAGPGRDRLERVRRQARESGERARAWTGLFTARRSGAAAGMPRRLRMRTEAALQRIAVGFEGEAQAGGRGFRGGFARAEQRDPGRAALGRDRKAPQVVVARAAEPAEQRMAASGAQRLLRRPERVAPAGGAHHGELRQIDPGGGERRGIRQMRRRQPHHPLAGPGQGRQRRQEELPARRCLPGCPGSRSARPAGQPPPGSSESRTW